MAPRIAGLLAIGCVLAGCPDKGPVSCPAANDGDEFVDGAAISMAGMIAYKTRAEESVTLTRCEVFTGELSGVSAIGIWSHDPASDEPDESLGTGTWTVREQNGWQGADLPAGVALEAGMDYWVVWDVGPGIQSPLQPGGTPVTSKTSVDVGATWDGPYEDAAKFRCECE